MAPTQTRTLRALVARLPGYGLVSRAYRRLLPGAAPRESFQAFLERVQAGAAITIDELQDRAVPYPTEILTGRDSVLVLFGAAFLGINDAIHIANAGITDATVVDIDTEKLSTMRALYPNAWEFVAADAFAFAQAQRDAGVRYDVVSADPYTDLMLRCRAHLPTFCGLARHAVVLGVERGLPFDPPSGWRSRRLERFDIADWIVLEPE